MAFVACPRLWQLRFGKGLYQPACVLVSRIDSEVLGPLLLVCRTLPKGDGKKGMAYAGSGLPQGPFWKTISTPL